MTQNLRARGYDDTLINKAIDKLKSDASLGGGRDLYEANRDVYGLLRYGVKVKAGVGEHYETVWLIDWATRRPTTSRSPKKSPSPAATPSARTSCSTSTASRSPPSS